MEHRFDSDIAAKYGLAEAILLNNIAFWVEKNRADKKCFFDGRCWMFCSVKRFGETFPYLTPWQIRNALDNLRKKGVLRTVNRGCGSTWYSLNEFAADSKIICGTHQNNLRRTSNEFAADSKPTLYQDNKKQDNKNNNIDPRACACEKKPEEENGNEKTEYAPNVFLTEAEHKALCEQYGEKLCGELITLLSEKKSETGKYGKRDFRSLSGWVYDAWRERNGQGGQGKQSGHGIESGSLGSFDLFDFAEKPPTANGQPENAGDGTEKR